MKSSRSALSTAGLAVFATLGVLLPRTAVARSTAPTWVQGAAFSTGSRVPTVTVTLSRPVAQGDLLVGWFSQYDAPEQVRVSDSVNGTWTRAPASLTFLDDTGDIALYYRENSQAAPSGMTITVSASSGTYLQGTVADYSGVALAGSLDQITSARDVGTAVDTGATAAVGAGELVFAALVTGGSPGSVTPGSSQGVPYTLRAETSSGSSYEADITSSAAGGQHGTATLASATNWFAVCAVFHPRPATPPHSPSTPTGLEATSVASTRVALSWSPSTGNAAGYTVYRDGSVGGTTRPDTPTLIHQGGTGFTTYTYSVDAFDGVNGHSAPSAPLTITTAAASPEFIQGAAASAGKRLPSSTLRLAESVLAGDLLVGWFGQFGAPGEVHVADDVNGPWTRSVSTTWGGTGDIALFYRENSAPAPSGLEITVGASAPAYLQEAVADYRGVATAGALDQATIAHGAGTYASVGPTASVPAGELVVAAVLTGGQPGSVTPGSSQMVPYVLDVQNESAASDLEDILSSADGPRAGILTLGTATNWVMVLAAFHPTVTTSSASSTTTTTSTTIGGTTTTTTAGPTTTSTTKTSTTTTRPRTTTTSTTPRPGTCTGACPIHTVFLILMENYAWSSIHNSPSAPYINRTLLPLASHAEQYYTPPNLHPSLPNYLWLEAGTNFGTPNHNYPSSNHQSTTSHLVNLLEAAGVAWRAYQENITGTDCPLTNFGLYDVNHDPFVYFDDVTQNNNAQAPRRIQHVRPSPELQTDLINDTVARYNFITPNRCNDMHNSCAPLNDPVLQGDVWLSTEVPKILASRAYANNGALFILWDEADNGNRPIGMIVLSPKAKGRGYQNTIHYTHSSTLRTVEEIFGVSPMLGDAANATDLSDLFVSFP